MKTIAKCELCGYEINDKDKDKYIVEGTKLCEDCYHLDVGTCDICGKELFASSLNKLIGSDKYACYSCYTNEVNTCDGCFNEFYKEYLEKVDNKKSGICGLYCKDCLVVNCRICGEDFDIHDAYFVNGYICPNCYDGEN